MGYLVGMNGPDEKRVDDKPLSGLQAALADIAERRRKDPFWTPGMDPTYSGPALLERMTEADYAAYEARREEERRWLRGDARPVEPHAVRQEEPPPRPQPIPRACLSFGERVRHLRRALGWTQREIAWQLGISTRTVIRYEQGCTHHPQSWTLLTLQDMESAYAQELDAYHAIHQPALA